MSTGEKGRKRWREEQKIKNQSSHGYKVICKREGEAVEPGKGAWETYGGA